MGCEPGRASEVRDRERATHDEEDRRDDEEHRDREEEQPAQDFHARLHLGRDRQLIPRRRSAFYRPRPASRHDRSRIRSVTLRLFDARRGGLHPFLPVGERPTVGMYVCGVTPYDTGHLGHAFTYVSFDVLHRYLEYSGHDVVYVQNLTDVDDDMLRKARETGENYLALGNRNVTTFLTEMAALNWLPPDHYPRAPSTTFRRWSL